MKICVLQSIQCIPVCLFAVKLHKKFAYTEEVASKRIHTYEKPITDFFTCVAFDAVWLSNGGRNIFSDIVPKWKKLYKFFEEKKMKKKIIIKIRMM